MLDEPTRWLKLSSDLFCHHPERQYKSCLSHALFTPVRDTQSSNTWYPKATHSSDKYTRGEFQGKRGGKRR